MRIELDNLVYVTDNEVKADRLVGLGGKVVAADEEVKADDNETAENKAAGRRKNTTGK